MEPSSLVKVFCFVICISTFAKSNNINGGYKVDLMRENQFKDEEGSLEDALYGQFLQGYVPQDAEGKARANRRLMPLSMSRNLRKSVKNTMEGNNEKDMLSSFSDDERNPKRRVRSRSDVHPRGDNMPADDVRPRGDLRAVDDVRPRGGRDMQALNEYPHGGKREYSQDTFFRPRGGKREYVALE